MEAHTPDRAAELEAFLGRNPTTGHKNPGAAETAPVLTRLRALVPNSVVPGLRMLATDSLRPRERRRLAALTASSPLRLHIGCGFSTKEGWLNMDLIGAPADVLWNVHRGLPFDTASVDAAFHEHVLEHFPLDQGLALTREVHRVLKPGGVLRIGVPDAGAYLRSYSEDDDFIDEVMPGKPTSMLAVQELFYGYGHQTMYDASTLQLLCAAAGFADPQVRSFGESAIDPTPDSEDRRAETLYVECVR